MPIKLTQATKPKSRFGVTNLKEETVPKEILSKPLFVKKPVKKKLAPRSSAEIVKEAKSRSAPPRGEPNY